MDRISPLTPGQLLGPLNDVEKKFAPLKLFAAGPMEIPLPRPRVAIIGSRRASAKRLDAAAEVARALVKKRVVVVSGLAEGIDTVAHGTTVDEGGRTIAILGTPLNRVYPQKNSQLQEEIMTNHLAVSQFPNGYPIQLRNFVMRNRTMALISNASLWMGSSPPWQTAIYLDSGRQRLVVELAEENDALWCIGTH